MNYEKQGNRNDAESQERERRRFVRISDLMTFRYHFLGNDDIETEVFSTDAVQSNNIGRSLIQINNQLDPLIYRLQDKNRELYEVVRLLNSKLNLLAESSVDTELDHPGAVTCTRAVSLSACGMAFQCPVNPNVNDMAWIELVLEPSASRLVCKGQVVRCERLNSEDVLVALAFVGLHAEDQEILIQHVVRRQASILREQRRKRIDGEASGEGKGSYH